MSDPRMVIAAWLGIWQVAPTGQFWGHANEIVAALDREGYEIRRKAEQ